MFKASNALVLAILLDAALFLFVGIPLGPLQPFQLNDAEEDTRQSRLLYPKRIKSFCESNLFILKLSVIGCLFRLSFQCHRIDRGGKEYRESTLGLHRRLDYF